MAKRDLPTPEFLRNLLRYDPETGILFWKNRSADLFPCRGNATPEASAARWNARFSGKPAFQTDFGQGYKCGEIMGQTLLAHRVAWAVHYGEWPSGVIDHINHDPSDNRLVNMRDVSRSENSRNQSILSNNQSGVSGVDWLKLKNKWRARISVGKKSLHLGTFDCFNAAVKARKQAEEKFGYHPNHGREMLAAGTFGKE